MRRSRNPSRSAKARSDTRNKPFNDRSLLDQYKAERVGLDHLPGEHGSSSRRVRYPPVVDWALDLPGHSSVGSGVCR